jgi:hypothetical protein
MKGEIKKYHRNRGHEGDGYSVELYLDGKKAAEVIDEGNGGPPMYHWYDTAIRDAFYRWIKAQPPVHYPAAHGMEGFDMPASEETFISDLVEKLLAEKDRQKLLKTLRTKCCFRLKSDAAKGVAYRSLNSPYSPSAKEWLVKKFGDDLGEILNETEAGV